MDLMHELWLGSGLAMLTLPTFIMLLISCLLIYLAVAKSFEPLILLPIGFGGLLANIPGSQIAAEGGLLYFVQEIGIALRVIQALLLSSIAARADASHFRRHSSPHPVVAFARRNAAFSARDLACVASFWRS